MIVRFWNRLRVYFGFSEDEEDTTQDGFPWDGVIGAAVLGMLAVVMLDVSAPGVAVAVVVSASALGWLIVVVGRKLIARR